MADGEYRLTAVDANPGHEITAGALNNPVIYRAGRCGCDGQSTAYRFWPH